MAVLTYRPKTRLSQLVARFGGVSRDDAIEGATKQLASMRSEGDNAIEAAIAELEDVAQTALENATYPPAAMQTMLLLTDRIVTLAGMFGYKTLDTASRGFCDVVDGLMRTGRNDPASIQVHIQAMRMMAPRSTPLPAAAVDHILLELSKIATHHGFGKLGDTADVELYE